MEQQIEILVFGQLTDITGKGTVVVPLVGTSDELLRELWNLYPALQDRKFVISIDQQIIRNSKTINASSKIALLPPFSGG